MSDSTTTGEIRDVHAADLARMLENGEAVLVDVREPDEHVRERIEGSILVPLSRFDPSQIPSHATHVAMHCKTGRRSNEAAARLLDAGYDEVLSLEGGIEGWKKAGLPTKSEAKAPIPIMRQVQITAGTLVVLGTVLGVVVSPWFLLLSGFVGAGLVFAGASGACGMAAILSRMPWNRVFRQRGAT